MAIKHFIEFIIIAVLLGGIPSGLAYPSSVAAPTQEAETQEISGGLPEIKDRYPIPRLKDRSSLGMAVTARNAIVADRDSGKILFAKNPDEVRPIASITKLMAAMVALDAGLDMEDVKARHAMLATLVISENNAAHSLAALTGLTEAAFVHRMNEKARALGLVKTHFVEPSGFSPENVSTVRELVTLVREASRYEVIRDATQRTEYQEVESTNDLLLSFINKKPYKIVAGKTGSLRETAKYCLALRVDEGSRGVIVIVLGSDNHFSRFEDVKALVYWAFDKWVWTLE